MIKANAVGSEAAELAPSVTASASNEEEVELEQEPSFLEPLERVFASLRRMATNYGLLAILDVRRAALQFAWLIGAGIVITVLLVTAWLAGVVAVAVWLFGQGLSWPAVLSIAALLNVVASLLVVFSVRGVFAQAPFSATLKQLKAEPIASQNIKG